MSAALAPHLDREPIGHACEHDEEGYCVLCGGVESHGTTYRCAGREDGCRCSERVRADDLLCALCEVDARAETAGLLALAAGVLP